MNFGKKVSDMKALSKAIPGHCYTIKWMMGFSDILDYIRSCHIEEGSEIRVIQNCSNGVIVGSQGRRMIIGSEVADRIQV